MRHLIGAALAAAIATAAQAEDVALIVGNEDYRRQADLTSSDDVLSSVKAFESAGFRVFSAANADAADLAGLVDAFIPAAKEADRVLVVLNGMWVHSDHDSWLVPTDAPAALTLAALPRTAVALSTLWPVLAEHPGRAVLVAGSGPAGTAVGDYLTTGVALDDVPQGVTTFTGATSPASWFVMTVLSRPGIDLGAALARPVGIEAGGFFPRRFAFLGPAQPGPAPAPVPLPDPDPQTETVFWDATRKADTVAGYEAYLRRYPNGPHSAEAKTLIEEIRTEPNRPARLVEDALNLSRDQRREIQRALSILGHDPKGIDGIFGGGSRAAITEWQTLNSFERSGYLTRDQIALLSQQAEVRAAELEREAEQRRREQEAQDRAYWAATGDVGDEAGLRSYLDRYPDGIFAALARERLKAIEDANRARAQAQERAQWDAAREENSVAAYEAYLKLYPKGTFADEAQSRIRDIKAEAAGEAQRAEAEAAEEALGLNGPTRLLIERRLQELELEPGRIDGQFDADTRRALRRYQAARGLPATGYMSEATVVRLLADSFGMVPGR